MAVAAILVDGLSARNPAAERASGASVALTNADNTGVASWAWAVIFRQAGSVSPLAPGIPGPPPSSTDAAPVLGPFDQPGTYHVRLAVNGATGSWDTDAEVDEIVIRVPSPTGTPIYIPAPAETAQGGDQGGLTRPRA